MNGRSIGVAVGARLSLLAAVGAIGARRWWQSGDFVTGLDGGSWFAFGRQLFGQPGGKPSADAYPPLVPVLLHAGRSIADPMVVAKLVGVGSLLAIVLATYHVASHGLSPLFGLSAATTAGLAGFFAETMAFGGYPQNYAVALMLVTAVAVARYLFGGARRDLIWAAAAWSGVALSHHMYFAIACLVVGLVWTIWLTTKPAKDAAGSRTLRTLPPAGLAVACFLPTFLGLVEAGYDPPINPTDLGPASGLAYAVREAPWFWFSVLSLGVLSVAATYRRRHEPMWQVAAALIGASAVLFPFTAEPRTTAPVIVGAVLGVGLALQDLSRRGHGAVRRAAPIAAVALPIVAWVVTDAAVGRWFEYYRVVDQPLLDAAAFVDDGYRDRTLVVRQDRRGWAMGWWFEGLTGANVVVGSDQKWLAFPEEQENARVADLFFGRGTSTAEVAELAARFEVDLLAFRKREWIGWQRWLAEPDPAVRVVYDDGEFMILDPTQPGTD